jgi:hypothetical protein
VHHIIYTLTAQGPTVPIWVPFIGGVPYNSPLIGSFIGVVLGFLVNYAWRWIANKRKRLFYIKLFETEFNRMLITLREDKNYGVFINPLKEKLPSKLQIDNWISAVNIGDLRLFEFTHVDSLSGIYSKIKKYNEDVELYKNITANWGFPINSDIETSSLYYSPRKRLGELNDSLLAGITTIKNENWMNTKHWWQYKENWWQFWK